MRLEQGGVVRRRKLGAPAGSLVYELTNWGPSLRAAHPSGRPLSSRVPAAAGPTATVLGHPLSVTRLRAGQTPTDTHAASLMPPCVLVN
jgi:hypothetical protein